ncbi:TetR/AcrR family transcriptional regulator [Nocardioides sp. 1609]|uniref:TetR/AcrR family transcriptional regulator n=1 Tax=Nocardioides sp. 1609 TaxID=2508327 RepID=UPI001431EBC5|nr:TetR/AcrR family transcriptional regulator [Nocardioides sp. 1609]
MTEPVKRRSYDSPARRAAAARTRRAVLDAAGRLFAERGWAGTSVAEVAREAGVSVDTVYTSVGRKPALLLAVHDDLLAEGAGAGPATERDYVRAVRAAVGARRKIEVYAEALGRLLPRTVPLLLALHEAGRDDPDCRALATAVSERRVANMRLFAADLRATGEVRPDIDDAWVANLVWSMNSPEYVELMGRRGVEGEELAALLARVWTATLLSPGARPGA